MSQKQSSSEPPQPRFPRVSGDEPWDTIWQGISTVFSLHERG